MADLNNSENLAAVVESMTRARRVGAWSVEQEENNGISKIMALWSDLGKSVIFRMDGDTPRDRTRSRVCPLS